MKEQILKLRSEGKTYNEIVKEVGCCKATVCYYCGDNQKERIAANTRKRRKSNVLISKIDKFKNRTISEKARSFQRRDNSILIPREDYNFTLEDVKNKMGDNPVCYLSGRKLDLLNGKSFHFDHIVPATKGGTNTLDNLGFLDATINLMKFNLSVEEFIATCKEVLEYNGYEVTKK